MENSYEPRQSESGNGFNGIKKIVVFLVVVALIVAVLFFAGFFKKPTPAPAPIPPVAEIVSPDPQFLVIGKSVEGREIESYTFGKGEKHLAFVGGIHGGYEWNAVLIAYNIIDYLKAHPETIPSSLTVTIIPNANPDGLFKIVGKSGRFTLADVPKGENTTGTGRFNANNVDLNRNFDCKWQPESTWRSHKVSAGTAPFSEPEAKTIRDFVEKFKPKSVVFWHSQSGAVYASQCENGVLPETLNVMNTYAKASGYRAVKTFDAYPTTGDADSWLASIGIPAVTIEFTTHDDVEFEKNLAGVKAVMGYYR